MQKPTPQATTNNPATLRFWDYFTALPLGTTLNVNTAPKAVLEAWFAPYNAQAAAQTILQDRETNPYTDINAILALPAFSNLAPDQRSALQAQLGVGTSHFQVVIDVAMASGLSRLVTRIQRPSQGDTRVFSRSLVPVLSALEPACNPD
jgi:general secretion pathway protein K